MNVDSLLFVKIISSNKCIYGHTVADEKRFDWNWPILDLKILNVGVDELRRVTNPLMYRDSLLGSWLFVY